MNWIDCIFCKNVFPLNRLIVSDQPRYWHFIHNIRPVCDFHCLIVLKNHAPDMTSDNISEEALLELGPLLNKASIAIKKCSKKIKTVTISSLNFWENSKHLHFHLIPVYENEHVKKVNSLEIDGGGFSFLSRKEIADDTMDEFIQATCWNSSQGILASIEEAMEHQTSENVKVLRKFFNTKN